LDGVFSGWQKKNIDHEWSELVDIIRCQKRLIDRQSRLKGKSGGEGIKD
jgi:hypothetical protein